MFYELGDLASLAATIQAAGLPNTLRNRAKVYWDAGLNNWASAPPAPFPLPNGDTSCPNCRICVVNVGNKGTLLDFRNLCYDVATFLIENGQNTTSVQYLRALADDMAGSSGAVEPWPIV